jgi:hypothetical protein
LISQKAQAKAVQRAKNCKKLFYHQKEKILKINKDKFHQYKNFVKQFNKNITLVSSLTIYLILSNQLQMKIMKEQINWMKKLSMT